LHLLILPVIDQTQRASYGSAKRVAAACVDLLSKAPILQIFFQKGVIRKTQLIYLDFSDGPDPQSSLRDCLGVGMTLKRHFDQDRHYPTETKPLPIFLDSHRYEPFFNAHHKTVDLFWGARVTSPLRVQLYHLLDQMKKEGYHIDLVSDPIPFEDYLRRMAQARLVVAPSGTGWHCYRPYEALLVGTVPLLDTPPVRYIRYLEQGVHALYFDSPEEIAGVISKALLDHKHIEAMAMSGRQYVLDHHTRQAVSQIALAPWR